MGKEAEHIAQRDRMLAAVLRMTDELLGLEAEVQALEAENRRLRATNTVLANSEQFGMGAVEQRVFEYGCDRLVDECFYTWNKVTQSSDTDEKAPCPYEQWRRSAYCYSRIPDWISVDQLYEVLEPQLRRLYEKQVKEFMEADDE